MYLKAENQVQVKCPDIEGETQIDEKNKHTFHPCGILHKLRQIQTEAEGSTVSLNC